MRQTHPDTFNAVRAFMDSRILRLARALSEWLRIRRPYPPGPAAAGTSKVGRQ